MAVGVSGLVLLVFPATAAVSGTAVALRPDWPWLLLGVFAFHGLAEELVWRGYAFRRLREGRSFWAATWWTMPLIAVTHVPIVATMGPAVGIGALAVAAVTSLPLAYLYETGRRTIWAPGGGAHRDRQLQARRHPGGGVADLLACSSSSSASPSRCWPSPSRDEILTDTTDTRSQG